MWLYLPPAVSTPYPSAPGGVGSISALNWQFQALERCAWSRGKPSPARNWFQRWKRDISLQRLFGAMPEPSTADLGVERWMASLAASRASHIPLPAESRASTTGVIYGPTPAASSSSPAHGSPSSKTSAGCSRLGLMKSLAPSAFGETYTSWVSRLRADCSLRQKSARAMSANASSSSQWPTPASGMPNDGEEPETWHARAAALKEKHQNGNGAGTPLAIAAKDFKASAWLTPSANEDAAGTVDGKMQRMLTHQAKEASDLWSTPRASDGEKGGPNQAFGAGGMPVASQTVKWPTPAVTDSNGARNRTSVRFNQDSQHHDGVTLNDAIIIYSPLVPETSTDGVEPSKERRSLNPLFVEWLMGWPPGWTLLAWTDFACSETALYLWRQAMQSALSSLGLPHEAPPAQTSLFD